ncbi:MAG: SHOCT domain-containing protein [Candidatus Nanopelagicales bacterium]
MWFTAELQEAVPMWNVEKEDTMMDWNDVGGSWGNGWMIGMMLIVLLISLGFGVWALITLTRSDKPTATTTTESARQILDRRLASGEIDQEQYQQLRRTLANGSQAAPHVPPR